MLDDTLNSGNNQRDEDSESDQKSYHNEDEVDSGTREVIFDNLITSRQVPRLEVSSPEVEAEQRMRVIRQVAAELRQISLDYEQSVRLRNVSKK